MELSNIRSQKLGSRTSTVFLRANFDAAIFDEAAFCDRRTDIPARVADATRKRKAEFLAARILASKALQALGLPQPDFIAMREDRSPVWPPGAVGSISHNADTAVVAVAPSSGMRSLGIDVEKTLSPGVVEYCEDEVVSPGEKELFRTDPRITISKAEFVSLIFCAKESFFKCVYPLTQTLFGFDAVEAIGISLTQGILVFRVRESLGPKLPVGSLKEVHFERSPTEVLTFMGIEND